MMPAHMHFDTAVRQYNQLGHQLTVLRQQRYADLSRIDSIGNEMHETIGLVAEIFACKLKVIELLLETPEEKRDFERANQYFYHLVDEMKKDNMECYKSLLDARHGLMEAGQFVKMTKEKKQELLNSFATLIDTKIAEEKLVVDESMDLGQLKIAIENGEKKQVAQYRHLLDRKTERTEDVIRLEESFKKTKEAQIQLFQNAVTNIWQASECGDIPFLQKAIDALWPWEKKDFVNNNEQGFTLLSLATAHGQLDCVKFLLANKADPKIPDKTGYQPLHWAAKKGNVEIGIELCKNGADLNARGEYGRTPLWMAVNDKQVNFIELLLTHGADINAQTDKGNGSVTALHEAVLKEDAYLIMALTKMPKLNVNLLDARNHSPLYYAVTLGCSDVAADIVGHKSFKWPKDPNDPNHLSQLLKITPGRNQEQIKKFLGYYL